MTIRQIAFAALLASLTGALAWAYLHGKSVERDRADLERAEGAIKGLKGVIEDAEKFNEGADGDADCGWFERLSGSCAADETAD